MSKEMYDLKKKIYRDIKKFYLLKKEENKKTAQNRRITYAKAIFDHKEAVSMLDSIFNEWLGLGPKAREFSKQFSSYLGVSKTALVNSGSSANLIALAALKSNKIQRPMKTGDEVITPAVTFPTTFNPIIQNGFVPKVVDANLGTLNIDIEKLKGAISSKTKAIILPHTLGNPNEMDAIMNLVDEYKLYLIEDNCDALGSEYGGKKTGSFGMMSTCSFYSAHHITMGEGGAVSIVNEDNNLYRAVTSLRDWGRDCWCDGDEKSPAGACKRRFDWEIDGIKYDHRYMYTHIGYNLKPTEIQAAMGVEQMKRIDFFVKRRRENFHYLFSKLKKYEEFLSFVKPPKKANPSWFAFPITLKNNCNFTRHEIITYLENKGIQTRLIFAGNIAKQPAYKNVKIIVSDNLANSENIMKNSFFIGVHPEINKNQLEYMVKVFDDFIGGIK